MCDVIPSGGLTFDGEADGTNGDSISLVNGTFTTISYTSFARAGTPDTILYWGSCDNFGACAIDDKTVSGLNKPESIFRKILDLVKDCFLDRIPILYSFSTAGI